MRACAALLLGCLLSQAALAADGCAVGPWPTGVPEGSIEFAEYQIIDLALSKPGEPMPWGSVLAPVGWGSSPGMRWSRRTSCARNSQDHRWTIEAPDRTARITLLPEETWKILRRFGGSSTASSCEVRPYDNTESFLQDLVARLASSAREVKHRSRPDILASRSPEEAETARNEFFEAKISAAELQFTFTSKDGPRDAVLISIVTMTESAPGIPERDVHGSSAVSLFASFPTGKMDARLVEAIRRSGFRNANWYWKPWQQRMREMKLAPLDEKMREAMAERANDVRPLGKAHSFGGFTFTATSAPDLWRDASGRYFLFPEGALPPACAGT
jgi:hypothetical protein